jgi:hypothetical protein
MKIFFFLLSILPLVGFAQITDYTVLQNCNTKFKKYLPKNYTIIDTANGDFNKDGKVDVVFVIEDKEQKDKQRGVIILEGLTTEYKLNTIALKVIKCEHCSGIYGDPYNGISFKGNVLTFNHYGGSAWRWSDSFVFRYQNKQWQLIGLSFISYHSMGCEESCDISMCSLTQKDINLSTQKAHFITTKDGTCILDKDYWRKIKVTTKPLLQNFDSGVDYFSLYK